MTTAAVDLVVLHEHPEWQKPLFDALTRRGVSFAPFDLTRAAFQQQRGAARPALFQPGQPQRLSSRPHPGCPIGARLHAIAGAPRRPGAQRRRRLRAGVEQEHPGDAAADARHRYAALDHFNDFARAPPVRRRHQWPALLKPDQGGSGARIQVVESLEEVDDIFRRDPAIWLPDNLFLLQEFLAARPRPGHRPPGVPRRRAPLRDAREDARPLQPVSVTGVQPG